MQVHVPAAGMQAARRAWNTTLPMDSAYEQRRL